MLPSHETIKIIIPIVSFTFLVLGFHRNIFGVIGYFIIMATRLGLVYPEMGELRIELIAALVVFISFLTKPDTFSRIVHERNVIHLFLIALTLVSFLSMLFAVNVSISWELGYLEYLKVFLFYLMIVGSIKTVNDLKIFTWAFIFITVWISYEPLYNYFSGNANVQSYGNVAIGSVGDAVGHVALANTLSQAVPLTYYWFKFQNNKLIKILLLIILAYIITGVVFSMSRGGFIALVAVAMGIIYLAENRKTAILVASLIFILSLLFVGGDYWEHMSTISHGIHGSRSSSDRYLGLINGIEMMIKRPLLGVGIGCYAEARSIYFNYNFYAHNLYGELLGELGMASMIWFLWIYHILKRSNHLKKVANTTHNNMYTNLLSSVQVALFMRLVIGNFTHSAFIWFWFVMAAMVIAIENLESEESDVKDKQKMV